VARRLFRLWSVLLFAGLSPQPVLADQTQGPTLYDVVGVAAGDVLNVRQSGDATAPIIGALPPDAKAVEVIGIRDGWGQVNTGEAAGYVKMSFLAAQPGPGWDALAAPMRCFGTEPFWSVSLTPGTAEARFSAPEGDRDMAIRRSWPGSGLPQPVAVDTDLGILVMSPQACSDGMSDHAYGIAAALFAHAPDQPALHGCCSIAP
jgi:uncharacterized membrane protein